MATLHIELSVVNARAITGATLPVADSADVGADTKTTSAVSQLSDLTGQLGQIWTVTATGGNVFLNFGAGTPVAASDDGRMILDGQTRDFAVSVANERLALKDA